MLPSRGIARSLGPVRARSSLSARSIPSRGLSSRAGDGRQFGTVLRRPAGNGLALGSSAAAGRLAAPLVLGSVASSRSLSFFGLWSSQKAPADKADAPAPAAAGADAAQVQNPATPPANAPAEALPAIPQPEVPSEVDASIADIINSADILNMPEGIGYLKAMGLEFGYGPSSVMQWVLEHVHVWGGLGWGATLIATAVLLRAVFFYSQVKSMQFSEAMRDLKEDPDYQKAQQVWQEGYVNRDQETLQRASMMMKLVHKERGVSQMGVVWGFLSLPFQFGAFRCINNMAQVPIPALETSSFLWITDLTARDPYFLLPVATTGLMFLSVWVGMKYAAPQQMRMIKMAGLPIGALGLIISSFLSAGLNLFGVGTALASITTALALNTPAVRRMFNLPVRRPPPPVAPAAPAAPAYQPPRDPQAPAGATPGFSGLRDRLQSSLTEMQKGAMDKMSGGGGGRASPEKQKERKLKDKNREAEVKRKQIQREDFNRRYKGGQ